jgi:hypothetical protein
MNNINMTISEGQEDPRDTIVQTIMNIWTNLNNGRTAWLNKSTEARRYLTGTDTSATEVGSLPWKNKTTIPKLTQIADNLQSYYMAALMPDDDWFRWEGADEESHEKANLIERYMKTKLKQGKFRQDLEKMVKDWIHYGNCFGGVRWVVDEKKSAVTGKILPIFNGPKLFRISPLDCVIDPKSKSFQESVFLTRQVISMSDLLQWNEKAGATPQNHFDEEVIDKVKHMRTSASVGGQHDFLDFYKDEGLTIDGFGFPDYCTGQDVELIEYWGDIFNPATAELQTNRLITIVDRSFVIRNTENPAWNGVKPSAHCGWRILPDNLYGQGPLDQLVGMQYRADHLENLKADTFDQIVHPMMVIKGDGIDDFEFQPGGKIFVGTDGDVNFLRPEASVLQANNEIAFYHGMMEQMAGSPRESMGFRTPGEKTAFEVDVLQQGADRMFQDKLNRFEEYIIQPILNLMFEMLVRNMDVTDIARSFNDDTKALELTELTREDVVADGILRPVGAKHFAARNKRIRELSNFLQLAGSTQIAPHISGVKTAEMFEQELGFEKFGIVQENIAVIEQLNSQAAAMLHQQKLQSVLGQEGAQPPIAEEGNESS